MRLIGLIVIITVAGIVTMFYLWVGYTSSHETITVSREQIVRAVYATGTVEPLYWAKLAPRKTGRLMDILYDEGQEVRKGDVIARLENRAEQQRLEAAKARLEFANRELARNLVLSQQNATSRKQLEDSQREQKETQAHVLELQRELDDLELVSPVNGIVLRRDIEPGETVQAGQVVFWTGQPKPLRITADIDEEDIARIRPGQPTLVKADAFPGQVLEGKVSEITPKGDPVNKVFRVRISLPDEAPLMPGMTTEINIITETIADGLVIPASSETGGYVWRIRGNRLEKTAIETGVRDESRVQVIKGLQEGETVLRRAPASGS